MSDFIEKKLERYAKFGSVLGLERMEKLMDSFGNPQENLKCIHIAGTNGKGSVSAYIYEVLMAAGYSVGLFTSPYILNFNERIQVDGNQITDDECAGLLDRISLHVDGILASGSDSPTEFEVLTAMAFLYFERKNVDFAVLEVGLGGSGDSTNIIKNPLITLISSISYDHMDRLGNSISEIAREKAGILKPAIPAVCNIKIPEAAKTVARHAYEIGVPLYDAARIEPAHFKISEDGTSFNLNVFGSNYGKIELSMTGEHQISNAVTALTALDVLRKSGHIKLNIEQVHKGMLSAKLPCRFERLSRNPEIIIDGAHNQEGAVALVKNVRALYGSKKILCVLGILADKEYEKVCNILSDLSCDFVAAEVDNERKLSRHILCEVLKECKQNVVFTGHLEECYAYAMNKMRAANYDLLLFTGSLYFASAVRRIFTDAKER